MAGNRANRNMNSVFQRALTADPDEGEGASDGRRRSRGSDPRRQQSPTTMPREEVSEEHVTAVNSSSSEDELVRQTDEEGKGAHEGACSASSGSSSVYLRGPASLP
jgi:hypothetical protein